jgi:hypothetical protein
VAEKFMTTRHLFRWAGLAVLLASACSLRAAGPTLKVADQEPPKEIDPSIRKLLAPRVIALQDGERALYQFWLRSEIPLKSKPASPDKALESVAETTLMGVVVVGQGNLDYKDNAVAAGVYTARFCMMPQDGDHMGTTEHPYFFLLVPATKDAKPDAITTYKALTKASGADTPSHHPVVLSLRPSAGEAGDEPKLSEPVPEHASVRVRVPGKLTESAEKVTLDFEIVYQGKGKT